MKIEFKLTKRLFLFSIALALSFQIIVSVLTILNHNILYYGSTISFVANFILVTLFYSVISNTKEMISNGYTLSLSSFLALFVLIFSFFVFIFIFPSLKYLFVCYIILSCFYTININRIASKVIDSNRNPMGLMLYVKYLIVGFILFFVLLMSSYTIAAYSVASSTMLKNGCLEWPWIPPGHFYPWPYSACMAGDFCLMMITCSSNQVDLFIYKYFIANGFLVFLTGFLWMILGIILNKAFQDTQMVQSI